MLLLYYLQYSSQHLKTKTDDLKWKCELVTEKVNAKSHTFRCVGWNMPLIEAT